MRYIGIEAQKERNNRNSIMLLVSFPLILITVLYLGCCIWGGISAPRGHRIPQANELYYSICPWIILGIIAWYIFAYFMNIAIIDRFTDARPLGRKGNKRVYNLVENICISCGMAMPKIHIIEDTALNAFACGINESSYTIVLTRGIIDGLEDSELEGVIAHEITHIRNNDVRLIMIANLFVGFFFMPLKLLYAMSGMSAGIFHILARMPRFAMRAFIIILIFIPVVIVGFCVSKLASFAISRNREYMADAGAVTLTKDSKALASALRKIKGNSVLLEGREKLVSNLLIEHSSFDSEFINEYHPPSGLAAEINNMLETHPPIDKRIQTLQWF